MTASHASTATVVELKFWSTYLSHKQSQFSSHDYTPLLVGNEINNNNDHV